MQENQLNEKFSNLKDGVKSAKEKITEFAQTPGTEDRVTSGIENVTSKAPSTMWLGLAVGSMVGSAAILTLAKRKELANFVGLWAPCFLLIGVYNKLVKLEGNDATKPAPGFSSQGPIH